MILLQDFKTGHITMSSPRSMFIAQIAGALMGAPCQFSHLHIVSVLCQRALLTLWACSLAGEQIEGRQKL